MKDVDKLQAIGHTMKPDSDFYAKSGQLSTGEDLKACAQCGVVVSWYVSECPLCALMERLGPRKAPECHKS